MKFSLIRNFVAKGHEFPHAVRLAAWERNITEWGANNRGDLPAIVFGDFTPPDGPLHFPSLNMSELPESRVELLEATMPTLPIMPVDLVSRGASAPWDKFKHVQSDYYVRNYPDMIDLKVNSVAGDYDVVALTNWRSRQQTLKLDLAPKLGLADDRPYLVFDFWNQIDLGVIYRSIDSQIEGHDTRVLFIRPFLDRPQLVGMSRHISGSYSLRSLEWDPASNLLRGTSSAPVGEPYILWGHSRGNSVQHELLRAPMARLSRHLSASAANH